MTKLGRDSHFVRIRLDIPECTYRHLLELYELAKAQGVTENPDVVAASCIDSVHELVFKKGEKNGEERQTEK